jgi:hypothetical protein
MALIHELITLSNTEPTLISYDGNDLFFYVELVIQNVDQDAEVIIGSDGLSAESFGMVLYPGMTMSFSKLEQTDTLYALSDTDESKLAIFRSSSILKAGK